MTLTEKFEKNIDQVNSDFQAIKSKLIECGVEVADGTKTAELAEKVGAVFDAGRKAGNDAFWDAYQQNGNRTEYNYAFANYLWTKETFRPKYNIAPTVAHYMFQFNAIGGDLVAILDNLEITLDFSKTTGMTNLFAGSKFTRIGEIDTRSISLLNSCFANANLLETIDKLKVREALRYSTTFNGCTALKNLTIDGTIAQNGFDVSSCTKLSKASILSILNALSTTIGGCAVTFSKNAVDVAFADDKYIGSESQEWWDWTTNQTDGRANWNFDLV